MNRQTHLWLLLAWFSGPWAQCAINSAVIFGRGYGLARAGVQVIEEFSLSANEAERRVQGRSSFFEVSPDWAGFEVSATNHAFATGDHGTLILSGEAVSSCFINEFFGLFTASGNAGFRVQGNIAALSTPVFVRLNAVVSGGASLKESSGNESRAWLRLQNGEPGEIDASFGGQYESLPGGNEEYVHQHEWLIPLSPGNSMSFESVLTAGVGGYSATGHFSAEIRFQYQFIVSQGPILFGSSDLLQGFAEVTGHNFSIDGRTVRLPRGDASAGYFMLALPAEFAPPTITKIEITSTVVVLHFEPFVRKVL